MCLSRPKHTCLLLKCKRALELQRDRGKSAGTLGRRRECSTCPPELITLGAGAKASYRILFHPTASNPQPHVESFKKSRNAKMETEKVETV